jgi:hypothetical protein
MSTPNIAEAITMTTYYAAQHPTEGFDIMVTLTEGGKIENVTDHAKNDIPLTGQEMELLQKDADKYSSSN